MGINIMNLVLAKTIAEREGVTSDRALQLGLVGSMMPSYLGVVVVMTVARREASDAPPPEPPAAPEESLEALISRARAEVKRLTTDTDYAIMVAQNKQAQASGTSVQTLSQLVTALQTHRGTLTNLDPDKILPPFEQFVFELKVRLLKQAEYAMVLDRLRNQVEAVEITSSSVSKAGQG